ncbi:hypothetical protein [uncultured Arcticibacterium sp.]|uniref:hypothetical protein n=1 Tax=uncultured Arcticibacterium sp. TaxID=2173042 RepID=UPI0030F671AC
MKSILSLVLVILLAACGGNNIKPKALVGEWENAYEKRRKDAKGEWSDWTTVTTYILLPSLEFTSDGDILWGGHTPTGCCTFTKYKVNKKTIKLSVPPVNASCAAVNCAACHEWTIEKLSNDILELNRCDEIIERYKRAN